MTLNKQQILEAQDIKTEDVQVDEWGGTVRVRAFSANVRSELMQRLDTMKKENGGDVTLPLLKIAACVLSMVDEAGNRLFTDDEMKALGEKSSVALDKVYAVTEKLNAVGVEGTKAIEKN